MYIYFKWKKKSQQMIEALEIKISLFWNFFRQFTRKAYIETHPDCSLSFLLHYKHSQGSVQVMHTKV